VIEVLKAFLFLGLTSFGGPVAHLGYFRRELVERRRWVSDGEYAQLLTLTQLLPGPASSQMGFALGLLRAGWPGAIAAFAAFTLPSAVLLALFALAADRLSGSYGAGLVRGLKLTAVCIVAHAVIQMARQLTPDLRRGAIALVAAGIVLLGTRAWWQLGAIALGALLGWAVCRGSGHMASLSVPVSYSRKLAMGLLGVFALLLALAIASAASSHPLIASLAGFYRAGALVFGGGHVVLPLLEDVVVASGFISAQDFLTGYGAAQAVPGPMFSFAAYLGMQIGGAWFAAAAVVAIFAPGFLLVAGTLPFWSALTAVSSFRAALAGINAAVVGILAAALYDPVCRTGIADAFDVVIALAGLLALMTRRLPVPAIVAWCVLASIGKQVVMAQ
jgi:chromate transporter